MTTFSHDSCDALLNYETKEALCSLRLEDALWILTAKRSWRRGVHVEISYVPKVWNSFVHDSMLSVLEFTMKCKAPQHSASGGLMPERVGVESRKN